LRKFAAVCASLFALAQAVLLALFLVMEDDRSRFTLRAVDAACQATFAALAAVTFFVRPLRNAVAPGLRGWRLLGVAATMLCVGQGLLLGGRLTAGTEPLNSWHVTAQICQGIGLVLVGGSIAVALGRDARRRSADVDSQ
jgi:hypothetical protein